MKPGRKPDPVMANRIRLNVGKVPACELAWLLGITYDAFCGLCSRMKISYRVVRRKL
jgi:hypothetical protein